MKILIAITILGFISAIFISFINRSGIGIEFSVAIFIFIMGAMWFYRGLQDEWQMKLFGIVSILFTVLIIGMYAKGVFNNPLAKNAATTITVFDKTVYVMCWVGIFTICYCGKQPLVKRIFSWRIFPIGALITIIILQLKCYQNENIKPLEPEHTCYLPYQARLHEQQSGRIIDRMNLLNQQIAMRQLTPQAVKQAITSIEQDWKSNSEISRQSEYTKLLRELREHDNSYDQAYR